MSEQSNVKARNSTNAFFLLLAIAVVVYFIARNLSTSSSIIISFVGLGIVIFVHEFGHFIAGKFSGIRVEAFAIGFGPIIIGVKRIENFIQFRILPTIFLKDNDPDSLGLLCLKIPFRCRAGETEYQLRIVPIGGFVKLLGQEDVGADKPSEDPRSFVNVAIWKRIVTVSAGVTLNVILAAILFVIVFTVGIHLSPAVIGDCLQGYPAAKAGLRAGDEIIEVDGKGNIDFSSIAFAAALSGKDQHINLKVKKTDGKIEDINVVPVQLPSMGIKGIGIVPAESLEIAKVAKPKQLYEQSGVKPGDVLTAIDGSKVEQFWQFSTKMQNSFEPNVSLTFKRPGQTEPAVRNFALDFTSAMEYQEQGVFVPSHIYGLIPRLKIASADSQEANEVLQKGDIIVKVADVTNPTYKQLRDVTTAHLKQVLKMTVLRNNELVEATVTPKQAPDGRAIIGISVGLDMESTFAAATADANTFPWPANMPQGAEIVSIAGSKTGNYFDIAAVLEKNKGKTVKIKYSSILSSKEFDFAVPGGENSVQIKAQILQELPFKPLKKLYKANGTVNALGMGSRKTVEFVVQTYMTLKGLIMRDISPKSLMGPVGMIAASSKIISEREFILYLHFMGMISACLAVMNFLPLPIFDGGLVVLLIIEKIKGSPVHEKVQEGLVYIGLAIIVGLILLVTYNDIIRIIFDR